MLSQIIVPQDAVAFVKVSQHESPTPPYMFPLINCFSCSEPAFKHKTLSIVTISDYMLWQGTEVVFGVSSCRLDDSCEVIGWDPDDLGTFLESKWSVI